jgi:hypothetical protein
MFAARAIANRYFFFWVRELWLEPGVLKLCNDAKGKKLHSTIP